MGWNRDEVWFDADVLWFRERRKTFAELMLAVPALSMAGAASIPIATGLEASRRRRLEKESARRRRLATRTVPAVALVLGSASMLSVAAYRQGGGIGTGPLQEDPPSLPFRLDFARLTSPAALLSSEAASSKQAQTTLSSAKVEWHRATSIGLPYSGRLVDGTQLPVEGPDWVTWDPATDSVPNLPYRLYGNEHTIQRIISVITAYRAANPEAPRVVVGDISFKGGGRMDEHVSHQNGLDVDVYYPRGDRHLSAPVATSQIDRALAQDLLDRFVAAGAEMVFVGFSTGLRGPGGVVQPYPNHENHMHVRFGQ